MIAFQIQIPANATAKDVANAIKIRAQLLEAGIAENMVATNPAPMVARAASVNASNGKGPNQLAWEAENGRSRFTSEMLTLAIATLPQGEQDAARKLSRDEQIGIFVKQFKAEKITRTMQGYKATNASLHVAPAALPADDDGETF